MYCWFLVTFEAIFGSNNIWNFCHSFYIRIVQSFTIIIIPNHEFTQKVELKLRIEAYFCTLFRVQHTRYGRYIHICRCFFNKQHRQRAKPIYPIASSSSKQSNLKSIFATSFLFVFFARAGHAFKQELKSNKSIPAADKKTIKTYKPTTLEEYVRRP